MRYLKLLILIALTLSLASAAITQDDDTVTTVTDDDVNAIAKQLYCPVCENIPLDTCGTAACEDWRYEIRLQLEAGMTEGQIIDDFVYRFGDRVVGTPQSTAPRLLSLVTPVIAILAGLYVSLRFWQSRRGGWADSESPAPEVAADASGSSYRDLLENDVAG